MLLASSPQMEATGVEAEIIFIEDGEFSWPLSIFLLTPGRVCCLVFSRLGPAVWMAFAISCRVERINPSVRE